MWDTEIPPRGQDSQSRTRQSLVLDHEFHYPPLVIMILLYKFGKASMGSLSEFFSPDYPSVNWKRAQPAPLSINNKNSAGYRQPLGSNTQAHGRTDWAAKYVHHPM